MTPLEMIAEWENGCSNTQMYDVGPENCNQCTRALIDALKRSLKRNLLMTLNARNHRVKLWPDSFHAQLTGECSFDLRLNDRMYQRGDTLTQCEYIPEPGNPQMGTYTGREITRPITFVVNGYGLQPGYVCLQLAPVGAAQTGTGTGVAP